MVQYIDKPHDRIMSVENEITAVNTLFPTQDTPSIPPAGISVQAAAFVASERSVDAQFL